MIFLKGNLGWCLRATFLLIRGISWGRSAHLCSPLSSQVVYFPLEFGEGFSLPLTFVFDYWRLFFLGTVAFISSIVLRFSQFYMEPEKFKLRFLLILALFVFRMGLLIIRGDILITIVGWDGLGLTSYLLVIYFNRKKSNNAGMLTALTNRLGDVGIILFIGLIILHGNFTPFILSAIQESPVFMPLLLLRGVTKRAQLPFSSWLPAAIAAPTPVSSLVHSSTLVTAGVYLLLRFYGPLEGSLSIGLLLYLRALTLLVSRVTAIFEVDIKKIIALSTLRQLALMFLIISLGQPKITFFHLNTHAFFKSLLFIIRGDLIHSFLGWQDLRGCGFTPTNRVGMLRVCFVANSRLIGFPFLRGFASKDLFLEVSFTTPWRGLYIGLIYLSLAFTLVYTIRFLCLVLVPSSQKILFCSISKGRGHEAYTPLLFVLRVVGGSSLLWSSSLLDSYVFMAVGIKQFPCFILLGGSLVVWSSFRLLSDTRNFWKSQVLNLINLPLIVGQSSLKFLGNQALVTWSNSEGIGQSYPRILEAPFVRSFRWLKQETPQYNFIYLRALVLLVCLRLL